MDAFRKANQKALRHKFMSLFFCTIFILFSSTILFAATDFVVDDFDTYIDTNDLLSHWDQWDNNETGSVLSLETNRELYSYKHQAMKYQYFNTYPYWFYRSEADRVFDTPQDWTTGNVKALRLKYLGDPNVQEFFVRVSDGNSSAVQIISDLDRLTSPRWQEFNFELATFDGVDLTQVRKLTLGVGKQTPTPGGKGTIYIDEIAAFPSRCTPDHANPADYDGDCDLDMSDLKWLVNHWMEEDYIVTAADPGTDGLVTYYDFNETSGTILNDRSANNYNGTVDGAGSDNWDGSGHIGGCLSFDGTFGVTLPTEVFSGMSDALTISVWINSDPTEDAGKPGLVEMGAGQLPGGSMQYQWDKTHYLTGADDDFADSWHHWAFVKDGDNELLQIYHDGVLVAQQADANHILGDAGTTRLGISPDGSSEPFLGKMDEMRIYNRALDHMEIVHLAGLGQVDQPLAPVFSPVDPKNDGIINFADFAWVALDWLDEVLWP